MAGKVTLKEIAREAGVSISTVSLVLNDRPCRVSEENRRRIKKIAREKRYVPNQIARSLQMQRSGTLGLIVPNIESRFFARLARNLEVRCRERGYALFITTSDDLAENDLALLDLLVNRGVEGVFLVMGNRCPGHDERPRRVADAPVPVVAIDRSFEGPVCDTVQFDNERGGYLATRHLLEHGHRRIACMVNAARSGTGARRLVGYRRALDEFGVAYRPDYVLDTDYYIPEAYEAAASLAGLDVTAVFASSDNIALGLLKRLYDQGKRVPRDYAVVSYDNSAADSLFEPALTAIDQDVAQLADKAIDLMLGRLAGGAGAPVECLLEPRLVERDSVAPCEAGARARSGACERA